jgi:hypothetical protein
VTITLSGSPASFDRHCYYATSGTATVTVNDRSVDPGSGNVDPTLVAISSASAPSFGAPAGKPRDIIHDPSKDLVESPYAVDATPITFTLPNLAPGTYDLSAAQIPGEPIAVLIVTGGG